MGKFDENYNGHNLSIASFISNNHYICRKCNVCLYVAIDVDIIWTVKFPVGERFGGVLVPGMDKLTCSDIIIKYIIE